MLFAMLLPAAASAVALSRPHTPCDADIPVKGEIVVLSMYGGKGAVVPYALTGDEHGAHAVSVNGSGTGRVTLVLSSYEATVWDLSAIASRVDGVIAHGHYPQAIAGLSKAVPVSFAAGSDVTSTRCFINYADSGIGKINAQARDVRNVLGRHPARWYGEYDPTSFDIDGGGRYLPPSVPPVRSVRAGVSINTVGLMPGNDGLEQMVAAGVLRRFSKADVNAWLARGGKLSTDDLFARDEGADRLDELGSVSTGYLLLKSIAMVPAGLSGANAVTFVVPEGVTMPSSAGHSSIYRLTGYPGRIPPAGAIVPIDDRARWLSQSEEKFDPAGGFVIWDNAGNVLRTGDVTATEPAAAGADDPRWQPDAVRTPPHGGARTTALWFAGSIVTFLCLLGAAMKTRVRETEVLHADEEPTTPVNAADGAGTVTIVASTDIVKAHVQQAIDLCHDDDTTLSLVKCRRMIDQAVRDAAYDPDLGDELSAIIDRHVLDAIKAYLGAARRNSGELLLANERDLRWGIDRLTSRIEELVAQQAKRSSDRVREQRRFILTRHPAADGEDLGG